MNLGTPPRLLRSPSKNIESYLDDGRGYGLKLVFVWKSLLSMLQGKYKLVALQVLPFNMTILVCMVV